MISVQTQDFDVAEQYQLLRQQGEGAIVTFCGLVRDFNQQGKISGLHLEHYPQMTEQALQQIVNDARARWPLGNIRIIHRVGELDAGEQIVFVGVTSQHRDAAFNAAQFIMDYLKTRAPIWKKEKSAQGDQWVASKNSDIQAASQWLDKEDS
ncbi:molybdopterin synthase catalytic subunit MoaE [Neptunicella sp. SCSIO 80796]|uniref:molybdopterin synthase catalytic subunit MoaE n=1 Tax=Neptunicella plasticusilytica TaxID=3117012 RepID=UPI003A4D2367